MANQVVKNGLTYWRIYGTYGRDDNGKLRKKEFLGKIKKEAEQKKKTFEKLLNSGMTYDDACKKLTNPLYEPDISPTLKEIRKLGESMWSWLFDVQRVSDRVKDSSLDRYVGLYRNYIEKYPIADVDISTAKSNDFQKHYNYLFEVEGKSHNITKDVNKLIKAFYNYEILQERLTVNPCASKKISLPGQSEQKKRTEIMPQEDFKRFIAALSGTKLEMLFLLCIGTGLRIGEILALKLDQVDLENCELEVVATIYACRRYDSEGNSTYQEKLSSTKNRLCRTVPIPSNLIPKLKAYLLDRKKHKFKIGSAFVEQNYLFPNMVGGALGYSHVRKQYMMIFEKANIPYKRIHSLRHSYASLLNANGTSISDIQELLGHSDVKTTQIYIHTQEDSKRKAADKLSIL